MTWVPGQSLLCKENNALYCTVLGRWRICVCVCFVCLCVIFRAKLASLFGLDQATSQGNESFQYTAPKQPRKSSMNSGMITENWEQFFQIDMYTLPPIDIFLEFSWRSTNSEATSTCRSPCSDFCNSSSCLQIVSRNNQRIHWIGPS